VPEYYQSTFVKNHLTLKKLPNYFCFYAQVRIHPIFQLRFFQTLSLMYCDIYTYLSKSIVNTLVETIVTIWSIKRLNKNSPQTESAKKLDQARPGVRLLPSFSWFFYLLFFFYLVCSPIFSPRNILYATKIVVMVKGQVNIKTNFVKRLPTNSWRIKLGLWNQDCMQY
jgi:hypothetical protein